MREAADPRAAVLAAAQGMLDLGLTSGTSGNVSARAGEGLVVITPSGVGYPEMTVDDLVTLSLDEEQAPARPHAGGRPGEPGRGGRRRAIPSTESPLHLACYRAFPEIGAVLHSHPPWAAMFAAARQPVPAALDEAVLLAGGEIPVAEYAISGSAELGVSAVRALTGAGSALLASHGLVTVAGSPQEALRQAAVVEHCAQVAWGARALGGHVPLPEETLRVFGAAYRQGRRG